MRRRATAVAAIAVLVAVALAVAGCARPVDADWRPAAFEPSLARAGAPEPADAAATPVLTERRIRNDAVGVQARYALLPGDGAFNDRVTAIVEAAVAARSESTGVAYVPEVFPRGTGLGDRACARGSTLRPAAEVLADPALGPAGGVGTAVVCDVVLTSGTFFGERIRVITGSPEGVESDSSTLLYVDTASGETIRAEELWGGAATDGLWTAAIDTLRHESGGLGLAAAAPPGDEQRAAIAAALPGTAVAADGSLVVTLPAGITSPELAELGAPPTETPTTVSMAPERATALLSPFGARLVEAVAAGSAFVAPAAVAAGLETVDCALLPCIALTYDDGPSDLTPGILDALAAHHGAATFFAMGEKASAFPEVLRRTVAEGHLVENHTWSHPHLKTLTDPQIAKQVRDTSAALSTATGQRVTMFRPPYGEYDARVLKQLGLPAILWDIDTLDWQNPADETLLARAVDRPSPGSIVLQHDIQQSTARTADAVYAGLADRGFVLVTVAQLFGGSPPTSGAWKRAP